MGAATAIVPPERGAAVTLVGRRHAVKHTRGCVRRASPRAATGIPLRRTGTSHEIATVSAFLLSAEASYVTGAHIAVDGGFLA